MESGGENSGLFLDISNIFISRELTHFHLSGYQSFKEQKEKSQNVLW